MAGALAKASAERLWDQPKGNQAGFLGVRWFENSFSISLLCPDDFTARWVCLAFWPERSLNLHLPGPFPQLHPKPTNTKPMGHDRRLSQETHLLR